MELTMFSNYFKQANEKDEYVSFGYIDKNPDNGGFSIFAGLQQLIECIEYLYFKRSGRDIKHSTSQISLMKNFLIIYEIFILRGQYMRLKKKIIIFPNEPNYKFSKI